MQPITCQCKRRNDSYDMPRMMIEIVARQTPLRIRQRDLRAAYENLKCPELL